MNFKEELNKYQNIINENLIKYLKNENVLEKVLNAATEYIDKNSLTKIINLL